MCIKGKLEGSQSQEEPLQNLMSLKFSKFNFSAAVDNIYAQFAPVNRGLNSAYIMLQQLFRKYFRYARMTSLKFSKFNFSAAISNIFETPSDIAMIFGVVI